MSESIEPHCITGVSPMKLVITIPPGWSWDAAVCSLQANGNHVALGSADQLLDRVLGGLEEGRTFFIRTHGKELEMRTIAKSEYKRGQGACRTVAVRDLEGVNHD